MGRRALMPLHKAQEMYGVDKTTFICPRYVPEGACEWCGDESNKKATGQQ